MTGRVVVTTISTSLSIVGCIIIFIAHNQWKDARSSSRDILLYITIADLFTAMGYLFGVYSTSQSGCVFQSFVTTASSMMSFFWTSCMALYLYAVLIKINNELGRRIVFSFHCISWAFPLLIVLTALVAGKLGIGCDTADWCWIEEEKCDVLNSTTMPEYENVIWMLVTGKFWEILSYILIIFIYARIFINVRKQRKMIEGQSSEMTVSRLRGVEKRTILIPVFYVLIRIWGTTLFFVYVFSGSDTIAPGLPYLQAFGDGAQGFVNAILFCLMSDKFKSFLQRCLCRKEGERESLLGGHNIGAVNPGK